MTPLPDLNALDLSDLFAALNPPDDLAALIARMRDEDLGDAGDLTSSLLIAPDARAQAVLRVRREGRLAGLAAIPAILHGYGCTQRVECDFELDDGDLAHSGSVAAALRGDLRDILAVERPILNLVGRLSGIATLAARYVAAARGCSVLDTRKTTPGLRGLEKYAVRCGGASLHRIGLWDAILVKDNHLGGVETAQLADFLRQRLADARALHPLRFIEVEVDSIEQFEAIITLPQGLIDIVLLDNFTIESLSAAVAIRNRRAPALLLEASGGVTLTTIGDIAATGVDRISVGAITHGAPSLDLGLDLVL